MAFAAFADAPVDVAVIEVGHGRDLGRHQRRRRRRSPWSPRSGSTTRPTSATRSARSPARRPGSSSRTSIAVLARSSRTRPPRCCCRRAIEVGADRGPGGHRVRRADPRGRRRRAGADACRASAGDLRRAVPAAARRAPGAERGRGAGRGRGVPRGRRAPPGRSTSRWSGRRSLGVELARPAGGGPGARRPSCVDAAHNPHGMAASSPRWRSRSRSGGWSGWSRCSATRTPAGCSRCWSRCSTRSSSPRTRRPAGCDADDLAAVAVQVFGADRVVVEPRLDDAIEAAIAAGRGGRGAARRRRRARHRLGRHRGRRSHPARRGPQVRMSSPPVPDPSAAGAPPPPAGEDPIRTGGPPPVAGEDPIATPETPSGAENPVATGGAPPAARDDSVPDGGRHGERAAAAGGMPRAGDESVPDGGWHGERAAGAGGTTRAGDEPVRGGGSRGERAAGAGGTPRAGDESVRGGGSRGERAAGTGEMPPAGEDSLPGGESLGERGAGAGGTPAGCGARGGQAGTPPGAEHAAASGGVPQVGEGAAAGRRGQAVRGTLAAGLILEGITVLFVPMAIARIGDWTGSARRGSRCCSCSPPRCLPRPACRSAGPGCRRQRAAVRRRRHRRPGPAMYFLGLLFTGVWVYLLWVRQEVTRAGARSRARARKPQHRAVAAREVVGGMRAAERRPRTRPMPGCRRGGRSSSRRHRCRQAVRRHGLGFGRTRRE